MRDLVILLYLVCSLHRRLRPEPLYVSVPFFYLLLICICMICVTGHVRFSAGFGSTLIIDWFKRTGLACIFVFVCRTELMA